MSYEEFVALGETKHHEYYDGLCVVNPPTRRHTRVVKQLERLLDEMCPETHEVRNGWGWQPAAEEIFEPDLLVCDRNASDDDILRAPPPMLVVEVSSPSTRDRDWGKKFDSYCRAGAQCYWIVDLEVPEIAVFKNMDARWVELKRFGELAVAPGPFSIELDPAALARL